MKALLYAVGSLLLCCLTWHVEAKQLTAERMFSSPALAGDRIRTLEISPDGSRVTFLRGKKTDFERLDLWQYDIERKTTQILFDADDLHSGEEVLSDEEKARRERMRLKGSGIVSYQWSKDGKALLFPLAGDIYYFKLGSKKAKKIVSTPEFETDVKFSPRGNYVSYIRNQNIYIFDLAKGKEKRITKGGGGAIKYGMAEFVAQEEMQRMTGYWWSNDESKIAFLRVDESPVELVSRSEIYADEIKTIQQRYPFAGKANVDIQLGITDIKKRRTRWVDRGEARDFYIPRVKWTQDNNVLSYQWQSRDQQKLQLKTVTWPSMAQQLLLEENSKTWINLHKDLRFTKDKKHFLWSSERSGFKHLYLYSTTGKLLKQLTQGDWVVDQLEYVDQENNKVYFTGRKDTPLERHLYISDFNGSEPIKLSRRSGYHKVTFAKDGQTYIDDFSTATTPPQISLHTSDGNQLTWLLENAITPQHPLYDYKENWLSPEFGSFISRDKTELYYRLYKPHNFKANKKYPVIVYAYGGPHVQVVANKWDKRSLFPQYLAQQGYLVFSLDNRGSNYRGKAFEEVIYRKMGSIEIDDQIEGVKFLHQYPWVDKNRIGIHGHSYGGYMTLMAMFKAPEYFKAGVSGAPVTDWRLYDTHYTERYMGHPDDGDAYEKASVFPYATQLKGPLLIYHGMADDNVLFKHSTKLYQLLQDNNIPFMTMDYPGKKHSIKGKKTQMHRVNMIRQFFDLHFKDGPCCKD